ncbi:Aryl-alcohol dehydrogenase [Cytospora mali]|uniref:Aryl-alcohol dehydrogenase n=1 Tax=Cytospora mali TaxID=578113 RepID=A0A194V528_CYTMA|nr:Aryl-alcohol dehydrogenase [Valsa mali var. pyri (nom. inval.)]
MPLTSESYVVRAPGGPITLETVHYDQIGEREMLVETVAVSVCATDIKAAEGKFFTKPPMILGHEGAGIVRQVGARVAGFRPGDKVVLHFSSCSSCEMCSSGHNAYCDSITELNFGCERDGAGAGGDDPAGGAPPVATTADGLPVKPFFFGQGSMGRHALVRETSAVKVDATEEELKLFASLSCGFMTGAGAVLNVCRPSPGASFAIFGAGAVGLAAALAAGLCTPARVIVVAPSQEKLDLIPAGVATHTIFSAGKEPGAVAAEIKALTGGKGVDYVLDCAGHGDVIMEGCRALKTRGMVVGAGGGPTQAPLSIGQMLIGGLSYRGTHQGDSVPQSFIPCLIRLWRTGSFPFDKLVSYYKMEDLSQALADLKDKKIIKPVLIA